MPTASRRVNLRSNSSQILIADAHHQPKELETYSMMKERELRPREEPKLPRFTKSGSNIVAAGAKLNVGPAKFDVHPENFYKSNRLSSKA